MNTKNPWDYDAQLSEDRLMIISQHLEDVLHTTYQLLDTQDDDNWSKSIATFGRQRCRIMRLCHEKAYEWLTLEQGGMAITFNIGSIPIRFFVDDHENPKKSNFFQHQVDQLWLPEISAPLCWRFVVEKSVDGEEASIYFVGYNTMNRPVCIWQYKRGTVSPVRALTESKSATIPIDFAFNTEPVGKYL